MSDNPRLTIELVDKGGTASPTYSGPAGSTGSAPYDSNADAQRRITQQGIPLQPAPPLVTSDPVSVAREQSAPPLGASGFSVQGGNPDLTSTIKGILDQDKNATAAEIAKTLGMKESEAQAYIDRTKGTGANQPAQQPGFTSPNQPTQQPASTPPSNPVDSALDRFASRVKEDILTEQERYQRYQSTLNKAASQGLLTGEEYQRARTQAADRNAENNAPPVSEQQRFADRVKAAKDNQPEERMRRDLDSAARAVDEGRVSREDAEKYLQDQYKRTQDATQKGQQNNISASQAGYVASNIANAIGLAQLPGGGVLQSALNITPYAAQLGAATGVGGALLAGAGVFAGVAGTATAAGYAAINEAERAVAISRQFSPEVAVADAISELRRIQADMRTASRLGDESADFLNQTSRLGSATQGIRDKVAEPILQELNKSLELLAKIAIALDKFTDDPTILAGLQSFIGGLLGLNGIAGARDIIWNSLPFPVRKYIEQAVKEADKNESPTIWFDSNFPHLDLPKPFTNVSKEVPLDVQLAAPVPGMQL